MRVTIQRPALRLAAAALLLAQACAAHAADAWPARAITMILPSGVGGTADPMARMLADEMGRRLGQAVVVQNRAGANGNLGMSQVARSAADGYTIIFAWTGPMATNLALYKNTGFDTQRDFAPVGRIGCAPNILVVNKNLPVSNFKEFMAYTGKNGDQMSYGTTGVGSSWHVAAEMVGRKAGKPMTHIPYTGPGPAVTDLLAGRTQAIFPIVAMTVPMVRAGEVKPLAVFASTRSAVLPEVPTAAEAGYADLVSNTCYALLAPKGTPPAAIAKLNGALNEAIVSPRVAEILKNQGLEVTAGAPALLAEYLKTEIPRQAELIKAAGVTPEE
ncbi:MAG: tripartite tricarboxylate transporter substrate binding protein [Pseudomonadota bacterium]